MTSTSWTRLHQTKSGGALPNHARDQSYKPFVPAITTVAITKFIIAANYGGPPTNCSLPSPATVGNSFSASHARPDPGAKLLIFQDQVAFSTGSAGMSPQSYSRTPFHYSRIPQLLLLLLY